jgi:predicted Zn-dependent protease with MMP-like domain
VSPFQADPDQFERLVADAVDALPEVFLDTLWEGNLDIVIEEWPDHHTLSLAGIPSRHGLLGFYHGVPKTARPHSYGSVPPDKISIYQRPIEAQCSSFEELRELVGRVVRHEIAHHFGIDDDRLHTIGAY